MNHLSKISCIAHFRDNNSSAKIGICPKVNLLVCHESALKVSQLVMGQ